MSSLMRGGSSGRLHCCKDADVAFLEESLEWWFKKRQTRDLLGLTKDCIMSAQVHQHIQVQMQTQPLLQTFQTVQPLIIQEIDVECSWKSAPRVHILAQHADLACRLIGKAAQLHNLCQLLVWISMCTHAPIRYHTRIPSMCTLRPLHVVEMAGLPVYNFKKANALQARYMT